MSNRDPATTDPGRRIFRRTLIRVLVVQVVALAVLWFLQARYGV